MASNSSATWVASSRVGTSTRAEGRASPASRRWTIGTANASVLPDPVGDLARTSFPARASGMTSDWIENGVWIDRRARAATVGSDTPRSENDSFDMWFSFSSVRDSPASKPPKKKREAHLTGSAGCRPCAHRVAVKVGDRANFGLDKRA